MSTRSRTRRSTQTAPGKVVLARPTDEDDQPSASDSEQEQRQTESSRSDDGDRVAEDRANSHAAAAAGPSSKAAAAGKGSKRAASVAFKDAVSLLPANMDEEMLHRTLQRLQPRNRMQKQSLLQSYRQHFSHWRFLLRQHFSLLLYGFGSKINLLELFAKEALTDGGVMAVYGHQPNMSAKQILAAVASALTHRSCKTSSHSELMGLINSEPACRQLYVLIHNIDGPGLRSPDEQLWLSRLAQAPAVHLIASIDHVNAALLWDNRISAALKWLWLEATSYASYEAETSNMLPILTSKWSNQANHCRRHEQAPHCCGPGVGHLLLEAFLSSRSAQGTLSCLCGLLMTDHSVFEK
eukprot:GHUV01034629.1.p1 GENE.GHUV01034629.1~~GHUV01034629.1.p1  ORF type:complete len:408 (+),score=68.47 GHUV01034629.1:167-1225(+)